MDEREERGAAGGAGETSQQPEMRVLARSPRQLTTAAPLPLVVLAAQTWIHRDSYWNSRSTRPQNSSDTLIVPSILTLMLFLLVLAPPAPAIADRTGAPTPLAFDVAAGAGPAERARPAGRSGSSGATDHALAGSCACGGSAEVERANSTVEAVEEEDGARGGAAGESCAGTTTSRGGGAEAAAAADGPGVGVAFEPDTGAGARGRGAARTTGAAADASSTSAIIGRATLVRPPGAADTVPTELGVAVVPTGRYRSSSSSRALMRVVAVESCDWVAACFCGRREERQVDELGKNQREGGKGRTRRVSASSSRIMATCRIF